MFLYKGAPALTAGLIFTAAIACSAAAQLPQRQRPLAGVTYTIRVGGPPRSGSGMAAAVASPTPTYTAQAIFAAGRGRMDIVDGGLESVFAKGDYVLFDSTDLVVVHPATREFVLLPHDAGPSMQQLESMGMKMTIADAKVTIDSVAGSDSVAGRATRHFRMITAFNMLIEAGAMQQHLATENITDYWVAAVPGLPGNPLLRANGFGAAPAMLGMFKELGARVDSAAAKMGSRVALRTITSSRLMQGPGSELRMQQTSEVSDLKVRDVDESSLVLPAGYKLGAVPGADAPAVMPADVGAKWRRMPGGRQPSTSRD
jgi:hypothetical protein